MIYAFAKTSIGSSHIKKEKACQDYSAIYQDEERSIATACDGHGSDLYCRSHLGSKFASEAIISVFSALPESAFDDPYFEREIKLQLLCEWNKKVDESLKYHPIRKEKNFLSPADKNTLNINPVKAYGSTLNGAMFYHGKVICASLGDGGIFLYKGENLVPAFEEDDEQVANLTHSLCQERAFDYLHIAIFDEAEIDGVLLCSDGVINPFQNLENFSLSLAFPAKEKVLEGKSAELTDFIEKMGKEIGNGDDVTLSLLIKGN